MRQRRLILDTLILGLAGAASAQLFNLLLRLVSYVFLELFAGYHAPALAGEGDPHEIIGPHGLWLVPVATTIGGLLVGLLIAKLAPEAEGHGTDTAVRVFHRAGGYLRARVPPLKLIASAITIGSGGAAGREGPIALVAAGVGSWYATVRRRTEAERRMLLLAGMAAGLSAIFRSPVGCAIFAIEVLYSDMEYEAGSLLYAMLAAVVAYAVNGIFSGWQPLFVIPAGSAPAPGASYVWFVVLGGAAGLLGVVLPVVFYRVRDLFRRLPLPLFLKPALGGLLMGLIAVPLPQLIGGGYGWIQKAIDGEIVWTTLAVLVFAKILAMALTVSSGGSGGVFAPTLFAGAMLGSLLAKAVGEHSAPLVVIGMAALFAGAARVPIASLMMVTEMTGDYELLVPAALAVTLAYLVQAVLSSSFRYRSLYEAQLPQRADSPAHHEEHLRRALRLLEDPNVRIPDLQPLDVVSLLRSGVPLKIAGLGRLLSGTLRPDSPLVGDARAAQGACRVLAILRDGKAQPVAPGQEPRGGDRVLLFVPESAVEEAATHLEPK